MLKKILVRIGGLIGVILLFLGGMYYFESHHLLQHYESFIGTNTSPREIYSVTDRPSHIAYLQTFVYEGSKIRYLDRGSLEGKVIVLLHGTPTNSWLWKKIVPGLIAAGYRVIVPDMIGFGASSMPTPLTDLSIEKQAQRLLALMDHLGIEKFVLGGHDQGSLWMWESLVNAPERISHLLIFNSIGDWGGFHPPAGFGEVNRVTKFTSRAMGSKMLGRIFAYGAMFGGLKNKRFATTRMIDGYLFPLLYGMHTTYYDFITDFVTIEQKVAEYQQQFLLIEVPVLVLWGSYDKILVGAEQIPVLKELLGIKDENIHMLDAAHFIQEEVPEEIVTYITAFVEDRLDDTQLSR